MHSWLLFLAALLFFDAAAARATPAGYETRAEVRAFAADLEQRHGVAADWVLQQLAQARLRPAAQRLMMPAPPGQPKNWAAYRERFVEPRRILAGVAFWQDNAEALTRAEAQYGVPPAIIVGIVGVETFYGRVMGNFRVLDALATLAFDFPGGRSDRSPFFRAELEQFLLLTQREGLPSTSFDGSFAGAIGLPQFMPSNIGRFAVDFDGDGRVDLRGSAADAIGSIARFLAEHGWQRGQPTHFGVTPPADAAHLARLLAPDILPTFSATDLAAAGAALSEAGRAHERALALVMVENGGAAPSYVAGTENFFALTRYNRSSYYALAVIELGAAVQLSL